MHQTLKAKEDQVLEAKLQSEEAEHQLNALLGQLQVADGATYHLDDCFRAYREEFTEFFGKVKVRGLDKRNRPLQAMNTDLVEKRLTLEANLKLRLSELERANQLQLTSRPAPELRDIANLDIMKEPAAR